MVIAWVPLDLVRRKVVTMWPTSSSTFVGVNRESEANLQSMGQYIEDYIDLVENVPNDIVRGITQFHEKNHAYHQLLDRLEKSMEKAVKAGEDESKRKKALYWIQKYLIDIQVLADEKLQVGQSIYEQLELKARQLDLDIRAINIGSGGSNLFSPIKARTSDSGRGSFPSTSQFARGQQQAVNNNNSSTTNGNGNIASEESQDSSTSPDQENGHEVSKEETPSGKRVSKKRHRDEEDDDDKESESPIKDNKRTRRIKSSKFHEKHSSAQNDREEKEAKTTREESSSTRRGKGKSGTTSSAKNGSDQHHSSSKTSRRGHRDTSPPSVYDEPSPLDPDEPTYCICQQISFGEMIGCDNSRCAVEWFHFSCVGLTSKPKGKWYCPSCRGERSNIQRK
jgi:inhibitor-of-growth protein 1